MADAGSGDVECHLAVEKGAGDLVGQLWQRNSSKCARSMEEP